MPKQSPAPTQHTEQLNPTEVMPNMQHGVYESMPYPPTRTKKRTSVMIILFAVGFVLTIAGIICFFVALERSGSVHDLAVRSGYVDPVEIHTAYDISDTQQLTITCPDGYRRTLKLEVSPDDQMHVYQQNHEYLQNFNDLHDISVDFTQTNHEAVLDVLSNPHSRERHHARSGVVYSTSGSASTPYGPHLFLDDLSKMMRTSFIADIYAEMAYDQSAFEPLVTVQVPQHYQGMLRIVPEKDTQSSPMLSHLIVNYQGEAAIDIDDIAIVEGDQLVTTGNININKGLYFVSKIEGDNVVMNDNISGFGIIHASKYIVIDTNSFYSTCMPSSTLSTIKANSLTITTPWPVIYDSVDALQTEITSSAGFVSIGVPKHEDAYTVHQYTGYKKDALITAGEDKYDIIDTIVDGAVNDALPNSELMDNDDRPSHNNARNSGESSHHQKRDMQFKVYRNMQGSVQEGSLAVFREMLHFDRLKLLLSAAQIGNHKDSLPFDFVAWSAGGYSGTAFAAYHAPIPTQTNEQSDGAGPSNITIHAPYGHSDVHFGRQ